MSSGNEIIFFGERYYGSPCMIIYNVISKHYTILSDDQDYRLIGLIFKRNDISGESRMLEEKESGKEIGDEYISLDLVHFSIYKYDGKNSHFMKKFTTINKTNGDIVLEYAMCSSLLNRNGMYLYHLAYSMFHTKENTIVLFCSLIFVFCV